jgi:uncharacterized membrane protein YdjX (TVP38/TMEM64 family)
VTAGGKETGLALQCAGRGAGGDVTTEETGSEPAARRRYWRYVPLVLALAGAAAVFATGSHRYLKFEALVDHHERLQAFVELHRSKALVLYMTVYIAAVTLSIPGAIFLTLLGGFLFGWLVGGAAAAIAATIGATGVFLIARTSVGDTLLRRAGRRVRALAEGFRADAFSYLLFLRFLPIVPFWITNLASALFGVPLKTFVLATQIGLIPGTFAFAVAGSGLGSVLRAHHEARVACLAAGHVHCGVHFSVKSLLTPQLIAAFVALGVLALVPVLVKRFYGRRLKAFGNGQGHA